MWCDLLLSHRPPGLHPQRAGAGGIVRYFVTDHLGSTMKLINSNGSEFSEVDYLSWGSDSPNPPNIGTSFKYTGQQHAADAHAKRPEKSDAEAGLYFYNARWRGAALPRSVPAALSPSRERRRGYLDGVGRFIQADTIIPEPGNPLAWDRYAYGYNNPVKYTDPSGHKALDEDPVCGKRCLANERRTDLLMTRILVGSGQNGEWTEEDYQYYGDNRQKILLNPSIWRNPDPYGLEGLILHVQRLSEYYDPNDKSSFIRDLALLYSGIDSTYPWSIAAIGGGKHDPLIEGMPGWAADFFDSVDTNQDQTHHYFAAFLVSFRLSNIPEPGSWVNQIRDIGNPGDQALDIRAAHDAIDFQSNDVNVQDFYKYIEALNVAH